MRRYRLRSVGTHTTWFIAVAGWSTATHVCTDYAEPAAGAEAFRRKYRQQPCLRHQRENIDSMPDQEQERRRFDASIDAGRLAIVLYQPGIRAPCRVLRTRRRRQFQHAAAELLFSSLITPPLGASRRPAQAWDTSANAVIVVFANDAAARFLPGTEADWPNAGRSSPLGEPAVRPASPGFSPARREDAGSRPGTAIRRGSRAVPRRTGCPEPRRELHVRRRRAATVMSAHRRRRRQPEWHDARNRRRKRRRPPPVRSYKCQQPSFTMSRHSGFGSASGRRPRLGNRVVTHRVNREPTTGRQATLSAPRLLLTTTAFRRKSSTPFICLTRRAVAPTASRSSVIA